MALKEKDGVQKHRRHCRHTHRSCARHPKTRAIGAPLEPVIEELAGVKAEVERAEDVVADATTDAVMVDSEVNDQLRNLHADCVKADRDSPGGQLTETVFPDGLAAAIALTGRAQANEVRAIDERLHKCDVPELQRRYGELLLGLAKGLDEAEAFQEQAQLELGRARGRARFVKQKARLQLVAVRGALLQLLKDQARVNRYFLTGSGRRSEVEEEKEEEAEA